MKTQVINPINISVMSLSGHNFSCDGHVTKSQNNANFQSIRGYKWIISCAFHVISYSLLK